MVAATLAAREPVHLSTRAPLTIAHVLGSFRIGGAEQIALDLAAAQRAAGHHVLAVGMGVEPDGPRVAQFRARGIEVHLLPRRPGLDLGMIVKLATLFHERWVSIVHTHNQAPLIYAAPAGWLAGLPVCHTKHGEDPDQGARRWLRRAGGAFVGAFVAVSADTARDAVGEVAARKIHVVPNGINLSRFAPDPQARRAIRAELGLRPDAWVVGTVGRLAPVKNQALLLQAAARSPAAADRIVIAGDGPEAQPLYALAAELGITDRVTFLGERHDVPRILAALDVFALPSLSEGMPLSAIEAMASGLPVVAMAVGGVPAVVRGGETGLLVRSGDAAMLAAALGDLRADPALAARMGAAGKAAALSEYSAETMARRYMDHYKTLLAEQGHVVAAVHKLPFEVTHRLAHTLT